MRANQQLHVRKHVSTFLNGIRNRLAGLFALKNYRNPRTRLINLAIIGVIVASLIIPILDHIHTLTRYKLTDQITSVLDGTSPAMASHISYDRARKLYQFNRAGATPTTQTEPSQQLGIGDGSKLYSADIHKDGSKGVTLYDTVNDTQISLTPLFRTEEAELSGNHFVLPLADRAPRLIYTAKANGLKEDIVLTTSPSTDQLQFSYKLSLPASMEARLTEAGGIGVYSADSELYGNISFGSEDDRARVESARQNAKKDHLAFFIPAPVIKSAGARISTARATFSLRGNILTVTATGLKHASYPLSIDPSIVVTSATDFGAGDGENIDIDTTNNLIKRASLTGGSLNTWSRQATALPTARTQHQTVIANGKMYILGGFNNVATYNTVDYATVNTDGSVGSFTSTSSFATVRYGFGAVAYNGYIYIAGGSGFRNDVQVAKILPNGALAAFSAAPSLNTGRQNMQLVAYNGFMYAIGGCTHNDAVFNKCDTISNGIEKATIRPDGTLSSWTTGLTLPATRYSFGYNVYQNRLYISGGCETTATNNGCFGASNTVHYSSFQADGNLSSWTATTNLPVPISAHSMFAHKGYQYLIGGGGAPTAVYYAPISADGSVGRWVATASITTGRLYQNVVGYNNSIIMTGGQDSLSAEQQDVQYATIKPAGELGNWSTTTSFTTARWNPGTVAMNGYLYIAGGGTGSCSVNCTGTTNVQYAAINSDGTVGSWTATTSLPTGILAQAAIAFGGYIYMIGGAASCTAVTNAGVTVYTCPGLATVNYIAANANGTLDTTWSATSSLNTARFFHGVTIVGHRIYVTGGQACVGANCSFPTSTEFAQINSDGTLGSWSTTTSLPSIHTQHGMSSSGQFVYVVGGVGGDESDVHYASVNTDGTLSAWGDTTSLPSSFPRTHAIAVKGYLYVIPVSNGPTTAQYAKINTDGTVGSWQETTGYTTARFQSGSAFYGDNLYILGGYTGSAGASPRDDVQVVNINNGGPAKLSAWSSAPQTLATPRSRHGVAVLNGYMYVMGGCSTNSNPCTALTGSVEYAKINSDGSLDAWSAASAGITARAFFSYYTYNGRIYVQGGNNNGAQTTYTRTIEFATPTSSGDITAWTTNTINTPSDEAQSGVVVYDGYAYRIGGINGVTQGRDVSYAAIDQSTGQVGIWSSLNNLTSSHQSHGVVLYRNFIYVIGGQASSTQLASVEYTTINADHTLSAWNTTSALNIARQETTASASSGLLCVIGGYKLGVNRIAPSECAPILGSGALSQWVTTSSSVTSRAGSCSLIYNGLFYNTGGTNSSADPLGTVEQASPLAISRTAHYTKTFDLDTDVTPSRFTAAGSLGGVGSAMSLQYDSALSGAGFGTRQTTNLTLGTPANLAIGQARYVRTIVTIDDSQSASFPDSSTTITDLEIFYRLSPARRLLRGKGFTGEALRPLDTEGP